MRASDIIQGLSDLIAVIQKDEQVRQYQEPNTSAELTVVANAAPQPSEADKTLMVPPLQQKIELLKKSVEVDNEFSNGFDQIDQEQGKSKEQPDDLDRMKKMAGINLVRDELAGDEPLDQ
jgi:hypothetical protein